MIDETTCPVFYFKHLEGEPSNHNICPCCKTQFGYSDCTATHEELRQEWVAAGSPFWDTESPYYIKETQTKMKELEELGILTAEQIIALVEEGGVPGLSEIDDMVESLNGDTVTLYQEVYQPFVIDYMPTADYIATGGDDGTTITIKVY